MEFRYVYRRVEDAIGSGIEVADSPHGRLALQLRHMFRERRDIAKHAELTALCMAAIAGNPRVNINAAADKVADLLDDSLYQAFPYLKPKKEVPDKGEYDEYFKQLEEFTASLAKKKEQESGGQELGPGIQDSKQKTENT